MLLAICGGYQMHHGYAYVVFDKGGKSPDYFVVLCLRSAFCFRISTIFVDMQIKWGGVELGIPQHYGYTSPQPCEIHSVAKHAVKEECPYDSHH